VSIRSLRHVRLASVVVVVLALVVTATALAARGDPKERFTPADQARARAMELRVGDLNPAYAVHPAPISSGGFYCAALDESDLTLSGKGSSPIFTATGEFVRSIAAVYATRADANQSWQRVMSPAGAQCQRTALRAELQSSAMRLVSLKRIPFPSRGTRSVAYRAVATLQGVRFYVDVVTMQVSRAEAGVIYVNALAPPPQSEVRRLTGLVATRAQKAMRGS
jgi:hypothetical protein